MIVAAHQPIFLPWPGFFCKAAHADRLVLLDDVQFPRGRSWLTRNRLKNETGELWLTVPVLRKGRGLEKIRSVQIQNEKGWQRKHLGSIRQNYVHAPYFEDYFPGIEEIYGKAHSLLADFNIELIHFLLGAFEIEVDIVRQSKLGVSGKGPELLAAIAEHVGAERFLVLPSAEKYVDRDGMERSGIEVVRARFRPPVYPQLWGDFIYNLSALDLLLNCGPRGKVVLPGG